jgi:hypothetical protein
MAVSCDKNDLAEAASCYCYSNQKQVDAIMIYLLNVISGLNLTANELAVNATPFMGISDQRQIDAIKLYLMCAAAEAAGA